MIYEQLELRVTNKAYHFTPLIEPANQKSADIKLDTLTVHRSSGELQLNASLMQDSKVENELLVYGILGFIRLQAGEYMIVITGCQKIGSLFQNAEILRMTNFQILPVAQSIHLTNQQFDDEQKYIQLLNDHLTKNSFYFSHKYPITLCTQKQAQILHNSWRDADARFFWNRYLSEKLINTTEQSSQDFSAFILPVIQGFVSITSTAINSRAVTFALISRRSRERAGTRFFSRGLNEHGSASNFVETEQLVLCDPSKSLSQDNLIRASYVQTRGSLPALWAQIPNLKYVPRLWYNANISDEQVLNASRLHFDQQLKHYGPQVLVNLVNTHGYEQPMGQLYASIVKQLADPNLKYVHFDFHLECRKMRWHRVQLLIDQLESDLKNQGYCLYDATEQPSLCQSQNSVIRSNCMDCLDRTNVVQSTIGKWVLNRQLRDLGILQSTEVIENDEGFTQIFKHVWADHADALSIPYSGTGALKTDFTRTGRRTRIGMINDFNNSAIRYIKNNYLDGARQDSIDLFLGNYRVPTVSASSPFKTSPTFVMIKLVPLIMLISFVLFLMILFNSALFYIESSLLYLFTLSFWFSISVTCWLYVQQNASTFVDWPRLVPVYQSNQLPNTQQYIAPQASNILQKAKKDLRNWSMRRNSSTILNEVEQGYELMPPLKKNT
ncbi:SacI homology domain-containing protein [Choanephora cucurbitarum]|nr:SacI homology domain-containing protein [Choanephora cucurbitarum]